MNLRELANGCADQIVEQITPDVRDIVFYWMADYVNMKLDAAASIVLNDTSYHLSDTDRMGKIGSLILKLKEV